MDKTSMIQRPQDEFLASALAVESIVGQQKLIKDVMGKVMVKDQHYGKIPGCDKPSLWKPGAEVICLTFRLAPDFSSETIMDGKHMTVRTVCRLTHIPSGKIFGSGEALCSTKEKKYRLRKDNGKIVENNNLEDQWNTVLKMANKRALVAAVLVVTAASDIFTQDMGEETYVLDEDDVKVKDPAEKYKSASPEEQEALLRKAMSKPVKDYAKKERGIWRGKVATVRPEELPGGKPCWTVVAASGEEFRTADGAFEAVLDGIDPAGDYEIKYEPNTKGTLVIQEMRDAK